MSVRGPPSSELRFQLHLKDVGVATTVGKMSKGIEFPSCQYADDLVMEASAFQEDFLDWASSVGILSKISTVCCDKDSSTHKLISEDLRYLFVFYSCHCYCYCYYFAC
jgi:hypothetical protein